MSGLLSAMVWLMRTNLPLSCSMRLDAQVSITFAPIVVLWLVCNAAAGIYQLARHGGEVFKGEKVEGGECVVTGQAERPRKAMQESSHTRSIQARTTIPQTKAVNTDSAVVHMAKRADRRRVCSCTPVYLLTCMYIHVTAQCCAVMWCGVVCCVPAALSPAQGIDFLVRNGFQGWEALGGVMLCVTGAEAMFLDMGHFSHAAISVGRLLRLSCRPAAVRGALGNP